MHQTTETLFGPPVPWRFLLQPPWRAESEKSGTSIHVVTLLNHKPDCGATAGLVAVPLLRENRRTAPFKCR